MVMIRKQIYLSIEDDRRLKAAAKKRGVSQAAIIRERLAETGRDEAEAAQARARLIEWLREIRERTEEGPGTARKFDRNELYDDRTRKARPNRHERVDQRGRPERAI